MPSLPQSEALDPKTQASQANRNEKPDHPECYAHARARLGEAFYELCRHQLTRLLIGFRRWYAAIRLGEGQKTCWASSVRIHASASASDRKSALKQIGEIIVMVGITICQLSTFSFAAQAALGRRSHMSSGLF
jgi:hypothetical protein